MRKKADLKRQRKIGISVAFLFVFILISIYLWDFSASAVTLEQTKSRDNLSDLAVQGATIVEQRIKGTTSVLWSMSYALEHEPHATDDAVMHYLNDIVVDKNTDFVRMGIVDINGKARITDGRVLDVSDKTFFQKAVQDEEYISSEVWQPSDEEADNIVIAVPVHDQQGAVKAVLYGIIYTADLQPYTSTEWDLSGAEQYIHVIDNKGNFIIRSRNQNSILIEDNLYGEFEKYNTTVPVAEIKAALAEKQAIMTQIERDGAVRYVYFAPMELNDWCVVTMLTGNLLEEQVGAQKNLVARLVLKILLTLVLFGGFSYWLIIKEKSDIERLNRELLIQDQIFRTAISKMGDYVFIYEIQTNTLEFVNYKADKLPFPQVVEDFPYTFDNYIAKDSAAYQKIQELLHSTEQDNRETELPLEYCGVVTDYRVQLSHVRDDMNQIVHIVGTLEDITEEKLQERKMQKSNQIRSAVLSGSIGFFEVDLNRDCLLQDGEPKESPYSYTEMIEKFVEMRVSKDYQQKVLDAFCIENLLHLYKIGVYNFSLEYVRRTADGEEFWVNCDAHLEKDILSDDIIVLATVRNIDDRKSSELELKKQVVLDPLTKVYNRSACVEKIDTILKEKADSTHAFLLLDLDNFKTINDNLGHIVGDSALVDVANILKMHVRPDDIVCRLGGDEFIVFLVDMPTVAIDRNLTKMLEKMKLTYERNGKREDLSASVGIALAPKHGSDFQTLYEKADIALYDVKNNNKNGYKIYSEK